MLFDVVKVGGASTVASSSPTNHVYVVDVSYSMAQFLPLMRQHLKNAVSIVAKKEDTFSIIYFSGKGQCGVVIEAVPVVDLSSVTAIQNTIDKWLTPIGLTGFHDPMALAIQLSKRLNTDRVGNFIMLTDGYDNVSNRDKVIDTARSLSDHYNSVAFIEYGWYCDRDLIQRMAEVAGGIHLFAGEYTEYTHQFETSIVDAVRAPRISVAVNKTAKEAMYIHDGNILIVDVGDDQHIRVPETVDYVYAVVPKDVLQKKMSEDRLYMVLFYALKKDNPRLAWRVLEALGDVFLIDQYTNAFTRQEITNVLDSVTECVFSKVARFKAGKDLSYLPPENVTTVNDILTILTQGTVHLHTKSSLFEYNRITKKQDAIDVLPRFLDNGKPPLITDIVVHSERANVSLQTIMHGNVEIPENEWDIKYVPSNTFRNYTVIRDGILNIKTLHLTVDNRTQGALDTTLTSTQMDVLNVRDDETEVVIHLSKLPVINRTMRTELSLRSFEAAITNLLQVQGIVKGIKSSTSIETRKTAGIENKYGKEAATWLSSLGVRDYGFSPKGRTAETKDHYVATEVKWAVKGMSSLPSVNEVKKKVSSNKKLTPREVLVYNGMRLVDAVSPESVNEMLALYKKDVKNTQAYIGSMVQTIILGKTWFDGEPDVVDTEIEIIASAGPEERIKIPLTISMRQVDIKV